MSPSKQILRGEAGILAKQTGPHLVADDEHGRGRAVVGAAVGVLIHPASKLAEGHHEHALHVALRPHVVHKGLHRIAKVLQQTLLGGNLVGVGVVAALRDVINARGQAAADEFGDELEGIGEWPNSDKSPGSGRGRR